MSQPRNSAFPPGLVIYQIYPRSFQDSNADGVGDLPGIIGRLDYLQDLGITAIWLSPFYPSPQVDAGYDISDYNNVDPLFGSLNDFDKLVAEAHKRDIKVVIDLVLNHTSDQHPWFVESRKSRDNPKRDWYVWRDAKPGDFPPNNWLSLFGGSAWERDPTTGQYYLHSFFKEQPDLNWANPEVRKAMHDVARFWLDRGVDGFRLDAVYWYAKDPQFRNDPINEEYNPHHQPLYESLHHTYSKGRPEVYKYMDDLAGVLARYDKRFMVSEAYPDEPLVPDGYVEFYKRVNPLIEAPFNFEGFEVDWRANKFKDFIDAYQKALKPGDTPVYVLGNHDRPRVASRFGEHAARAVAMLLATLPGASVLYYGDELGMLDTPIKPEQVRDTLETTVPGYKQGRDPERTPMQWSREKYAGFSSVKPWLPVNSNFTMYNVSTQLKDPGSLLNLYRELLAFRKKSVTIQQGSYEVLSFGNKHVYGYMRSHEDSTLVVVLNFSNDKEARLQLDGQVVISTHGNSMPNILQPGEGKIIEL